MGAMGAMALVLRETNPTISHSPFPTASEDQLSSVASGRVVQRALGPMARRPVLPAVEGTV